MTIPPFLTEAAKRALIGRPLVISSGLGVKGPKILVERTLTGNVGLCQSESLYRVPPRSERTLPGKSRNTLAPWQAHDESSFSGLG